MGEGKRLKLELVRKCDFCGRTQHQVDVIISAPSGMVDICDTCVRECVALLDERKQAETAKEQE